MQPTLEYYYKYFIQQGYARMVSRMWFHHRRTKHFTQQAYAHLMSRLWFQHHGHAGDERRYANCSWEEWERRKKEKEDARNT